MHCDANAAQLLVHTRIKDVLDWILNVNLIICVCIIYLDYCLIAAYPRRKLPGPGAPAKT